MQDIINDFDYDATDIEVNGYALIPKGEYNLQITEVKPMMSNSGFPRVNTIFEIAEGPHLGRTVLHYVNFLPAKNEDGTPRKGAGIAISFLDCINEPHEGKFRVNPYMWVGKTVKAKIDSETYEGKTRNKIKYFIKPINLMNEKPVPTSSEEEDESLPF